MELSKIRSLNKGKTRFFFFFLLHGVYSVRIDGESKRKSEKGVFQMQLHFTLLFTFLTLISGAISGFHVLDRADWGVRHVCKKIENTWVKMLFKIIQAPICYFEISQGGNTQFTPLIYNISLQLF